MMFVLLIAVLSTIARAYAFEPLFDTRVDYYEGAMLSYSAAADIDNDNFVDLIDVQWEDYSTGHVFVRKNLGNGTFGEPDTLVVGRGPRAVVCRDFDGDGYIDLAVTNYVSNNISILINRGDGAFEAQRTIYVSGPWAIDAFDYDNDGDQDLVVAEYDNNNVVFFNNNAGSFNRNASLAIPSTPIAFAKGDFNADADTDLAVICAPSHRVQIIVNHHGTFQLTEAIETGPEPRAIAAGDVDNDGDIDLAVVVNNHGYNNSIVTVMTNDGAGWFYPHHTFNFLGHPKSILLADIDNDGDNDLAGVCDGSIISMGYYAICFNNGVGAFGPVVSYGTGQEPFNIFAADVDNDGDLDLGASIRQNGDKASILKNRGGGDFHMGDFQYSVECPWQILSEDFNQDGNKDLAVLSCYDSVHVFLGTGDGQFVPYYVFPCSNCVAIAACDFDGDSFLDLAALSPNFANDSSTISIYLNPGDARFFLVNQSNADFPGYEFTAADFNNDNYGDIAIQGFHCVNILMNSGHGNFLPAVCYSADMDMGLLVSADFDRDGYDDIAIGSQPGKATVIILFNNGAGEFQTSLNLNYQDEVYTMFAADFNGDTYPDLALRCSSRQFVILSNGNRTFGNPRDIDWVVGDIFAAVADMDNDGDVDILSRTFDNTVIFMNSGNASFEPTVGYGIPYDCLGLVAADFDNDGDQDIIARERDDDYITVFLNHTAEATNVDIPSVNQKQFSIPQNYPNPFNASTTIKYDLPKTAEVTLSIFDILGRKIETINAGKQSSGQNSIVWNARHATSGIYFYKIQAGDFSETKRCLLLK
jgi:hypothetical protein